MYCSPIFPATVLLPLHHQQGTPRTNLSSGGGATQSCAGPGWWGLPGPAAGTGFPDGRGGGGPAPTPGMRWH